jgi:outer membrane receptor protein involved in Fe transport
VSFDDEVFRSNNVAVPDPVARNVGRMSLTQRVPSTATGGIVQWSRTVGTVHAFSAGTDWKWVKGDSQEEVLNATNGLTVTLNRVAGGRQRSLGGFVQDVMTLSSDLTVTLSLRGDAWRNYDGHNLETNVPSGTPGTGNEPTLAGAKDTAISPKAAALYRLADWASVWGSFGTGFRAPTLNELYRQFRVGPRLTLANNQLGPSGSRAARSACGSRPWLA